MIFEDASQAATALNNPKLPATDLADIANRFPQLWPLVVAHPAAYPDLLAWLDGLGDPAIGGAVAERRARDNARRRHSHKLWLITAGIVVVLAVVVATVLFFIHPWSQPPTVMPSTNQPTPAATQIIPTTPTPSSIDRPTTKDVDGQPWVLVYIGAGQDDFYQMTVWSHDSKSGACPAHTTLTGYLPESSTFEYLSNNLSPDVETPDQNGITLLIFGTSDGPTFSELLKQYGGKKIVPSPVDVPGANQVVSLWRGEWETGGGLWLFTDVDGAGTNIVIETFSSSAKIWTQSDYTTFLQNMDLQMVTS